MGYFDCWEWTGCRGGVPKGNVGYGYVHLDGRGQRVHRVVYEVLVGPIPSGYELHHLCKNPACYNPDHLLALTPREHGLTKRKTHCVHGHRYTEANTYRRANGHPVCRICARRRYVHRPKKTHCKHGHKFTPENTYVAPDGERGCRICRHRRVVEFAQRKKEVRS